MNRTTTILRFLSTQIINLSSTYDSEITDHARKILFRLDKIEADKSKK